MYTFMISPALALLLLLPHPPRGAASSSLLRISLPPRRLLLPLPRAVSLPRDPLSLTPAPSLSLSLSLARARARRPPSPRLCAPSPSSAPSVPLSPSRHSPPSASLSLFPFSLSPGAHSPSLSPARPTPSPAAFPPARDATAGPRRLLPPLLDRVPPPPLARRLSSPPPLLGLASTRLTSAPSSSAAALPRWYPRRRRRPASGLVNFDKEVMARYYNIHDIIMEEEPISVIFQVGANGVGLLDPGSETNSVEKGAKVDLPFWLSHELYLRQAVSINVPSCFSQKTRKEVQADAACVDLRSRCPYFYELGCKIVPIATDKSIGSFVHYAFTSRYKEILSKSHSAPVSTAPKFLAHLTNEESQLFEAARSSMASFKKWRVGGSRLEKASILGRKRKTTISQHSSTE